MGLLGDVQCVDCGSQFSGILRYMAWLPRKNIENEIYTRLAVLKPADRPSHWVCLCTCGTLCIKSQTNLRRGDAKSCGCLKHEVPHCRKKLSRKTHKTEYSSWAMAKSRCNNPKDANYHNYGARGIKMSKAWEQNFETFYADVGPRPQGLTLDRIDYNGNYEKGNCRWATQKEQQNNKRTNVILDYRGERLNMKQWSTKLGISYDTILDRMSRKLPTEKVLSYEGLRTKVVEWGG